METQEKSLTPEGNATSEVVTPEVKTPTTEEQLRTLQAQLTEKDNVLVQKEESYKSLQRNLNKTTEELKRQRDLREELAELKETQRLFAAMLAEKGTVEEQPEGMPQGRKQELLTKFEELQKQQEEKRKQADVEAKRQEYIRQADEIWNRAKTLGIPEDDDTLLNIEDYLKEGNLKRAEITVKKFEAAKKPVESKKEEPKETEEQRINRLVEERLQQAMKEKGLLKTDSATPSGRAVTKQDIIKRYAEGDTSVSESDYLKAIGRG